MINKRENLLKQLDNIKVSEKKEEKVDQEELKKKQEEDMRERKKRLLAQRDLILKKKEAERKEQTQEYQKKQNDHLESLKNKINLTDLKDAPILDTNTKNIYKQVNIDCIQQKEESQKENEKEEEQPAVQKISNEEMERRKEIMNKIKKQM